MKNYQEKFEARYPSLDLKGRTVEYFDTVEGKDLIILREEDSLGYYYGEPTEVTDKTYFLTLQPFGVFLKLANLGLLESYPNLSLTLQRLMATLPSAVETMVAKGKECQEKPGSQPEEFYTYLTDLETEDLVEIANFCLTLRFKIERLPDVEPTQEFEMDVFAEPVLDKLLSETKAMTEPMFDSWLTVLSTEDLNKLLNLGELGLLVKDELAERELENAIENI